MDIVQQMRKNRAGSRAEPRKRQIRDLIQLATLYQREGLLPIVDVSHQEHASTAAEELSVAASISVKGAAVVLKLLRLRQNESAWNLLLRHRHFAVFEAEKYIGLSEEHEAKNKFCLSFLEAFLNCEGVEESVPSRNNRRLLDIAASFNKAARERCVTMFLESVSVISTLSSFFPKAPNMFDKPRAVEVVQRYLSENWLTDSRQAQYRLSSFPSNAYEGWLLVTEVFKVQVQELFFWKQKSVTVTDQASIPGTAGFKVVTEVDLMNKAHLFCHRIIVEFLAWIFRFYSSTESIGSFMESFCDVMDNCSQKLATSFGCAEEHVIPSSLVLRVLELVKKGAPTMAEIRYTEDEMVPAMRSERNVITEWDAEETLYRCRWDDSSVNVVYEEFLKSYQQARPKTTCDSIQSEPRLRSLKRGRPEIDDLRRYRPLQRQRYDNLNPDTSQGRESQSQFRSPPYPQTPFELPYRPEPIPSRFSPPFPRIHGRTPPYEHGRGPRSPPRIPLEAIPHFNVPGMPSRRRHIAPNTLPVPRSPGMSNGPVAHPNYYKDGNNSDSESVEDDEEEKETGTIHERSMIMNDSLHELYVTVLSWPIFPVARDRPLLPNGRTRPLNAREKLDTHLLTGMRPWLQTYVDRGVAIVPDVTNVKTVNEYRNHWKTVLPIEIRAAVQEQVGKMLPQCKAGIKKRFQDELDQNSFIGTVVKKFSATRKLVNLTCVSFSPVINKRIAEELQGGTMCMGYISSDTGSSDLILMGCRRASWEPEDVTFMGDQRIIERIELHVVVSRQRIRDEGVYPENRLYIRQICCFSPYLRMHKAIQLSDQLTPVLLNTLFGERGPSQASETENLSIDPGCAQYLQRLEDTSAQVDKPQLNALRTVLETIGECQLSSSSASLVHGPPGTGKTTTIIHMIGALMHHSLFGHVGRDQQNDLKTYIKEDKIVRCRETPGGIRILVCAPSNQGVENILQRIHEDGIPDGKGGTMWPQIARLARSGYNHGRLEMYSVEKRALPFDDHIYNVGAQRRFASAKARKALFKECIVVLTTLGSSGGSSFKNIKVPFDVVIVDEAGQSIEPEVLIPLTTVSQRSRRCHFIAVGDHQQLPPFSAAQYPMKVIGKPIHFNYDRQIISVFERLLTMKRARSRMLTMQYRMCRAVADMNNMMFYDGLLESPLPESKFDAPYNQGWDPEKKSFSRMTFIDTSHLSLRGEVASEDGDYRNSEEIRIIDEILDRIKELSGERFSQIRGQIAVLSPYSSQVEQLKMVLERTGKYVPHGVSRQGFDILIGSVDSMQGSERDIVIFGTTRSNKERKIGFLEQVNRLNVATSRAKKLQIMIGDMSTLDANHNFCRIANFCDMRRSDVALMEVHETNSGYILDGLRERAVASSNAEK